MNTDQPIGTDLIKILIRDKADQVTLLLCLCEMAEHSFEIYDSLYPDAPAASNNTKQ